MTYRLIKGYSHVAGIPLCPCRDPGNYVTIEQDEDRPMHFKFTCWCGRHLTGNCDTQEEVDNLINHGFLK